MIVYFVQDLLRVEMALVDQEIVWRLTDDAVFLATVFRELNYLEYTYLQLGRYRDARRTLDVIAAQYDALTDKKTAADTEVVGHFKVTLLRVPADPQPHPISVQ